MEKKEFIKNRFKKILIETFEDKAKEMMEKMDLYKEVPFGKPGKSFDYVQEREMCNECGGYKGGEMMEGEMCECGSMYEEREMCDECGGYKGGDMMEGEMCECGSMNEELKGGQKKLDVEKPFGKLTKADFDKLRKGVKKHMNEYTMGDDDLETVKPYGDFSTDSPKKIGKVRNVGDKYQRKVSKEFDDYELEESEENEGNAFTGMLKKTPKGHSFKLAGKEYRDRSSLEEKWNKEVDVEQTGEYSDMSIEELNAAIKKQKAKNDKTMESGKKVSHADKTKMSQLYFAKRAKQGWKGKGKAKVEETLYRVTSNGESALFTENEMIDLIESIVNEEKIKSNIKSSTIPKGMSEYERVHKADKKEEDQYFKELGKKMTDYTKGMSDKGSKYEMKETQKFPTENGGMEKGNRKKYTPSDAVDEYIDAFSYPGMTNLVYDEIKPNDEWIEANIKGSSKTGNAQVDEDGNALGNVVPSKTGDKFYKNYEENLYGQEQQEASYKRQPQPVDQAGEHTERGSLKSKRGKKTAQSVLNKLEESITPKEKQKLSEEFVRMQQLMGYDHKTQ